MAKTTFTLTIDRATAHSLGILDREIESHLESSDVSWLTHNIRNRMTDPQRRTLHEKLTEAVG